MNTLRSKPRRIGVSPKWCAERIGHSEKFWRDRCVAGDIRASKVGRIWVINRDALMTQLDIKDEEA